jgi:hypothetical protein
MDHFSQIATLLHLQESATAPLREKDLRGGASHRIDGA